MYFPPLKSWISSYILVTEKAKREKARRERVKEPEQLVCVCACVGGGVRFRGRLAFMCDTLVSTHLDLIFVSCSDL